MKLDTDAHNRRESGFSIVELLTVMAVITVLVGVLLPVIIQARNRARSSACLSNVRQLSQGVALYCQDWSDRYPLLDGSAFPASWPQESIPYGTSATYLKTLLASRVRSEKVYKCPNDTGAPEYGFVVEGGSVFNKTRSSYLPWSTARTGDYGIELNGSTLSSIKWSSAVCVLRDYGGNWHGLRLRDGLETVSAGRVNAAFADGHVANVPASIVTTAKGSYVGMTSNTGSSSGTVSIGGSTCFGNVDLTGRYRYSGPNPTDQLSFYISGEVTSGDGVYEVDKVMTFPAARDMRFVLRQIAITLESQYGGF